MKADQKKPVIGDHLWITRKSGGSQIRGALVTRKDTSLALITNAQTEQRGATNFTIVPESDIEHVEVRMKAPQAIYEESRKMFRPGIRVAGHFMGIPYEGKVIAAWNGVVVALTDDGIYFSLIVTNARRLS